MIAREWVLGFAKHWIEASNSHDLDRILSHYTDDVKMTSPPVVERLGQPDGVVKGKDAVREYWRLSTSLEPALEFGLMDVLVGIGQITLYYRSADRKVVGERLLIDGSGKATHAIIHWPVGPDKE